MDVTSAIPTTVQAFAPGRVNLIGDHTDHTGGLCLPMALTWGVTVTAERSGDEVVLRSTELGSVASLSLDTVLGASGPSGVEPPWARYVAGVLRELRPEVGLRGTVSSDLPIGAGLSSSAALEVAVAMALGASGTSLELAELCQRAERAATGVPCGILDQLTSVAGVDGHALLLDCHAKTVQPIPMPDEVAIVVVHSGQERTLAGSPYAVRRAECAAAEERVGPLRLATADDVGAIRDPVLRRRARHVVTENRRVVETAEAFAAGNIEAIGALMSESHRSLRDDFESSTRVVDALVERLRGLPGVHGARLTGGGWGGCVVALTDPGALEEGWTVRPGPGARLS